MAQYQLGALSSVGETFCGLHLYFAKRCRENLQSAKCSAQGNCGPATTWLVGVTIYCTISIFNNKQPPLRQFLGEKILLKKNWLGEMIIE